METVSTVATESAVKVVYMCHPFGSDPTGHREAIVKVCRALVRHGALPLAPQLLLPQFLDEYTERDLAMRFCLRLVGVCDEVRVYGEPTVGMHLEIDEAHRLGIPVVAGDTEAEMAPPGDPPR